MNNIIRYAIYLLIIFFITGCGDINIDWDLEWIEHWENYIKDYGLAYDELGHINGPSDWDSHVINVELLSYPDRIIYIKGVDNKIVWDGCTAKQTKKGLLVNKFETVYHMFFKDRLTEIEIDYNKLGIQKIHIKMNKIRLEKSISQSYPYYMYNYGSEYTIDIIIPIQIIFENFYDDVRNSLNKNHNDIVYVNDIPNFNYDKMKNVKIIEYPSRIAYVQGLDTELIWDGCVVEITMANELYIKPLIDSRYEWDGCIYEFISDRTYVKPFHESGLIDFLETDVDFDKPGVYPVYFKGNNFTTSFPVQVISEDFYEKTKESLLK